MKIIFGVIIAVILYTIIKVIISSINSKRISKKVHEMATELDAKGIHNYTEGFNSYGEVIAYYKKYYPHDYLLAEGFAYVVLKHEISPYRSDVKMIFQDDRMQTCHRIMLDQIIGTPYERCLMGNPVYREYCMNLGMLYTKYAMQNMSSRAPRVIYDVNFISTPFPIAFMKICNEVYGADLGI